MAPYGVRVYSSFANRTRFNFFLPPHSSSSCTRPCLWTPSDAIPKILTLNPKTFQVLLNDACNLLHSLSTDDYKEVKKTIINGIISQVGNLVATIQNEIFHLSLQIYSRGRPSSLHSTIRLPSYKTLVESTRSATILKILFTVSAIIASTKSQFSSLNRQPSQEMKGHASHLTKLRVAAEMMTVGQSIPFKSDDEHDRQFIVSIILKGSSLAKQTYKLDQARLWASKAVLVRHQPLHPKFNPSP
jgi:hypothetical protein